MPYQRICHLFFIFKLAVTSFIWKKILSLIQNHYSKQIKHLLRVFLLGRLGCSTKKKIWVESPCTPKILNFPLLLNITPTKKLSPPVSWSQITYWKKKVLTAFIQILSKILLRDAFSVTQSWLIWKN